MGTYGALSHLENGIRTKLNIKDVEYFLKTYSLLYACDTILLAKSEIEMQRALDAVYEHCYKWSLTVNNDKTKIVIFSSKKVTYHLAFIFGHCIVEVTTDHIYPGIKFCYIVVFNKLSTNSFYTQKKKNICCITW